MRSDDKLDWGEVVQLYIFKNKSLITCFINIYVLDLYRIIKYKNMFPYFSVEEHYRKVPYEEYQEAVDSAVFNGFWTEPIPYIRKLRWDKTDENGVTDMAEFRKYREQPHTYEDYDYFVHDGYEIFGMLLKRTYIKSLDEVEKLININQ